MYDTGIYILYVIYSRQRFNDILENNWQFSHV